MQISNRKKVVVGATLGLLAFSSGLGIAYYNATIATTPLPAAAQVSPDRPQDLVATLATAATGLVPGAPALPLVVDITNPNPYHVGIQDTLELDFANLSSVPVECTHDEALLSAAPVLVDAVLAPNGGTTQATFQVSMGDSTLVDQTDCIGAVFTIPVKVAVAP